ncbi:MAG TPA: tetratricopeptide repeat protein [Symbiobacteriaceae bacterium]|jgi:TolA-binding protein
MATCNNCGAEMTGQYCDTCGARAQEERSVKKVKKEAARVTSSSRPANALAPQRVWKSMVYVIIGALLLFGGMFAGFYMSSSPSGSGPLTSTATDATGAAGATDIGQLTPLGQAGELMDQGVALMTKGDRTGAVATFRKSIDKYTAVLKEDPENLYARSYMGLTYYYAGDSKGAVDNLNLALKKDPNYLWALFNLAWIYDTGNKKPEALELYKKYLAVVETEKQNGLKYAEQFELIPQQIEAAKKAIETIGGAGK